MKMLPQASSSLQCFYLSSGSCPYLINVQITHKLETVNISNSTYLGIVSRILASFLWSNIFFLASLPHIARISCTCSHHQCVCKHRIVIKRRDSKFPKLSHWIHHQRMCHHLLNQKLQRPAS